MRKYPHLHSQKALRDRFKAYRELAGLDEVYMRTLPCGKYGNENKRYRVTIYSLRHYAIQRFYSITRDLDLTRRFARHRHTETTEVYLKTSRKEEIERVVSSFSSPLLALSAAPPMGCNISSGPQYNGKRPCISSPGRS
jgi:hypothetical protein